MLRRTLPGAAALFLDRDGVLNRRIVDGYVLSPDNFEFNGGLLALLRRYSGNGVPLVVVSNQACIGRGFISEAEMRALMGGFEYELRAAGVQIAGWYCCPHAPAEGCACRKPQPGMLHAAARDFGFDLAASCIVGDSPSDLQAGRAAGVRTCISYDMERDGLDTLAQDLEHWYGR